MKQIAQQLISDKPDRLGSHMLRLAGMASAVHQWETQQVSLEQLVKGADQASPDLQSRED